MAGYLQMLEVCEGGDSVGNGIWFRIIHTSDDFRSIASRNPLTPCEASSWAGNGGRWNKQEQRDDQKAKG
jgi:hypothetical protein